MSIVLTEADLEQRCPACAGEVRPPARWHESCRELQPYLLKAPPLTELEAFRKRGPAEYLIPGWLPRRGIGMVYGEEWTGKSFLMQSLAVSLGSYDEWSRERPYYTHLPWLGMPVTYPQEDICDVIYCMGEGHDGAPERFNAIMHDMNEEEWSVSILIDEEPFKLTPESARKFVARFKYRGYRVGFDVPCGLVVFDSKMDYFEGDENSNTDGQAFAEAMKYISKALDCPVIVIDHTGHDNKDRARGASRLRDMMDFRWQVTKGTLTLRKNKEGAAPDPVYFAIRPVEGTGSARPERAEALEALISSRDDLAERVRTIIEANPGASQRSVLPLIRKACGVNQNTAADLYRSCVTT